MGQALAAFHRLFNTAQLGKWLTFKQPELDMEERTTDELFSFILANILE